MRISGGRLSGRTLKDPTTRAIRPMRDAVRLALFNIWGGQVEGGAFLDLFAGTGSVGIEALSRGARQATFVEQLPQALRVLDENLRALELQSQSRVIPSDVFAAFDRLSALGPFDLIFVGPPYGKALADQALQALSTGAILAADGCLAAEVFRKERLQERYDRLAQMQSRQYGDNLLVFYRWQGASDTTG